MKLVLLTLITMLVISCGKPQDVTETKISLGAIATPADYPGGLFILMHNPSSGLTFFKHMETNLMQIDVPNGNWLIGSIGWPGTGIMEGNAKCEMIAVPLNGGEVKVQLNPTQLKCAQNTFGNLDRKSGSVTKPLRVISCASDKNGLEDTNQLKDSNLCTNRPGKHQSFKVLVHEFLGAKDGEMFSKKIGSVESACISASSNNVTDTNPVRLTIPEGFPFSIRSYTDNACANASGVTHFPHGMDNGQVNPTKTGAVLAADSTNDLYLDSKICADGDEISGTAVSVGSVYYVCSNTQFADINNNPGGTYRIASDIDFLNGNTGNISATFTGKIYGQGYTLRNYTHTNAGAVDAALIDDFNGTIFQDLNIENFNITVGTSAVSGGILGSLVNSAQSVIKNIHITNSTITVTNAQSKIGILIGQISNTATGRKDIENITIENSNINVNADNANQIGLLAGRVVASSPNIEDIYIHDSKIQNSNITLQSNTIVLANQVGGAIGFLDQGVVSNLDLYNLNIEGDLSVGGLIGQVDFGGGIALNNKLNYINLIGTDSPLNINFGGVYGNTNPGSSVSVVAQGNLIQNISFDVETSGDYVSQAGGVIGRVGNTATDTVSITNNKVYMKSSMNGQYIGGAVGRTNNVGSCAGNLIIEDNIIYSNIGIESTNSLNKYRGGIAGNFQCLGTTAEAKNNFVYTKIAGSDYLGGGAGELFDKLTNNNFEVDIYLDNSATINGVGGIAGYAPATNGARVTSNKIRGIMDTDYSVAGCNRCGKVIGNSDIGAGPNIDTLGRNLTNVQFDTTDGTDTLTALRGFGNGSTDMLYQFEDETIDHITSSSFDNTIWIYDSGDTKLISMYKLEQIGAITENAYDIDEDGTNETDNIRAGNFHQPIILSSTAQWNTVGNDPSLLRKTYKLGANLNFGGTAAGFTPFGGKDATANKFSGSFIPNGYRLENIRIEPSEFAGIQFIGIFRDAGINGPMNFIGTPDDPFRVDNITIFVDATSTNIGTIAGIARNLMITARVTNATIQDTTSNVINVGGFIGVQPTNCELIISESLFDGDIIDTSFNNFENVGGIIGKVSGTTGAKTTIRDSAVKTQMMGSQNIGTIGGLIGNYNPGTTDTSAEIVSNYVYFKPSAQFNGSVSSGLHGYLIGSHGAAAATKNAIHNNFVDITNIAAPIANTKWISNGAASDVGAAVKNFVVRGANAAGGAGNLIDAGSYYATHLLMANDGTGLLSSSGDNGFYYDAQAQRVKLFWE